MMIMKIAIVYALVVLNVVYGLQQMCCDAVVPSSNPPGKIGIGCNIGGIDCGFAGQVTATCARLSPIGARQGTAVGCQ